MTSLHRIFKALADPTRLRILNLLLHQPSCVCELESALGLPQPLVSRHLAYLRNAGLVRDRRQGMRVQYSVLLAIGSAEDLKAFLLQALPKEEICRTDLRAWQERHEICCPVEADGRKVPAAYAGKGEML